jgi:hypothetical protein
LSLIKIDCIFISGIIERGQVMKALKTLKLISISIMGSLMLLPFGTFAQEEYDDMYFTPRDRKEVKKESVYAADKGITKTDASRDVINPSGSTQLYGNAQESYSSKNVNPEYIERYKSTSKNSATVETLAEDDSYYVENYDRSNFYEGNERDREYTRPGNYSGYNAGYYGFNDPFMAGYNYYGRGFYDPFWNPYYGSGWGMMPGFSMSLSFGSGWGYNPWHSPWGYSRFYNPWYSRYYYSPWAYDPWFGPYSGFGYGYHPGFYSNRFYYVNTGRENVSPYNRRVPRGADNYVVNENAPNRRTATVNQQKVTDGENINNRSRVNRDYSRSQNEYYSRARSGYENTTRANNSSVTSSRSGNTVGTTTTPRVRSSRNEVEYSRPSYRSATQSRGTYSGSSNRSSWSDNSSQRSRSGNSYSSPSRSNSNYSNQPSYNTGSSSGSRSSGYSAPSRSSGSSSSGSGSRSSGRR